MLSLKKMSFILANTGLVFCLWNCGNNETVEDTQALNNKGDNATVPRCEEDLNGTCSLSSPTPHENYESVTATCGNTAPKVSGPNGPAIEPVFCWTPKAK